MRGGSACRISIAAGKVECKYPGPSPSPRPGQRGGDGLLGERSHHPVAGRVRVQAVVGQVAPQPAAGVHHLVK